MDDGPEQGGQDDYEPDVAARAAPAAKRKAAKRKAAKEYFLGALSGLISSADALAKAVRLKGSQRPLPVQAIGVQDNSPWQRGSFMGCFRVRNHRRFPISQNVGKRDSAVRAALDLFQKADCDRSGDRIARGCFAGVRVAGEHCESSDASAVTFSNRLEDGLQDFVARLD